MCVIGAGVVGCSAAYELVRAGYDVVLVDGAPGPGTGASLANGAQLSYSYVEPLASPATLRALPWMLLNPQSPLAFRPKWDAAQWRWLLKFIASCRASQARKATLALLATAALSRQRLEAWLQEDSLDVDLRRNGKLVLCADSGSLERQALQVKLQAGAGPLQEVLNREDCLAREPALVNYRAFIGGIWTSSECSADPHQYCVALVDAAIRRGLQPRFTTRAVRFVVQGGRVVVLETDAAPIHADVYVIATGVDAPRLASQLDEQLAIYPVKGYSLTLNTRPGAALPSTSVTDLRHKTVLAPLGGRLRVAAMAEIVGRDLTIPQKRIDQMMETVDAIYPGLCDFANPSPWSGLRPATPTALPIVRQSR
ncbi:MAG: FAD-dependent oxidoreductase, partial [Ramlibacter sp.]